MLSLLLSLILSPAAEARSIMQPVHHYAQIVDIKTDGRFPYALGTVTFMKGCGEFSPQVQLSKPVEKDGEKIVKLRVQLTSLPGQPVCQALPSEEQLEFTIETESGPVTVVADTDFEAPVQTALIERIYFQPDTYLANQNYVSGSVLVDQQNNMIALTLYRQTIRCPEGQLCIAGGMAFDPFVETVPLQMVNIGDCRETIYSGSVNKYGTITEIQVIDNTTNYCETYAALPATEIRLRYISQLPTREEHRLHASTLQLQ